MTNKFDNMYAEISKHIDSTYRPDNMTVPISAHVTFSYNMPKEFSNPLIKVFGLTCFRFYSQQGERLQSGKRGLLTRFMDFTNSQIKIFYTVLNYRNDK